MLASTPALAAVPQRKNIDALSAEELANYKHAIQIVMDRGAANPALMTGYAWQAALHNDFDRIRPDGNGGGCEHRNELFFPWHRAHLASFEKILRESDPPRTENVAIPYWDWTKPASGVRFPKAFEDTTSPLFHAGRFHRPEDVPPLPTLIKAVQWDADAVKNMVQLTDWSLFSGNPRNEDGSGGSFGDVEKGPHNTIHQSIGPTMGNPASASRDPIYWSFHACIDLIWARWQRVHTSATRPQPFATPQDKIWVEPFIPVVQDMAQTDTMPAGFAYTIDYDFSIDPPEAAVVAALRSRTTVPAVQRNGMHVTATPTPVVAAVKTLLHIEGLTVFHDLTYALRVYVHPPSLDLSTASDADRARYQADFATIWASGGHHGHPTALYFDLTKAVAALGRGDYSVSLVSEALPLVANARETEAALTAAERTLKARPLWNSLTIEVR
jgi:tyrosinase